MTQKLQVSQESIRFLAILVFVNGAVRRPYKDSSLWSREMYSSSISSCTCVRIAIASAEVHSIKFISPLLRHYATKMVMAQYFVLR